jgi:hypothetical protein
MNRHLLLCAAMLAWPSFVYGQIPEPSPPTGPAQIFNRAQDARSQGELKQADKVAADRQVDNSLPSAPKDAAGAFPDGHPPTNAPALPAGHPPTVPQLPAGHAPVGSSTAGASSAAQPQVTSAGAAAAPMTGDAADLPAGTLEIIVRDPAGAPYANGEIVLGVMANMGGRTEQRAKTNAQGVYTFRGLSVGSKQAYRVNVTFEGAKFSSNPFRISETSGYRAEIALKPVTHSDKLVFGLVGQTIVEFKDDRLHIVQSLRLANAGNDVFALPQDGMVVPLPEGFTAFQWQDQMTDQRATEMAGKGFRLAGSLPPGNVTLAWAFDLPRAGDGLRFPVEMPFRTYTYRVIAEAPKGLKLRVGGFPEAEEVRDQGRDLLFTQLRRSPPEAPISPLSIRIEGIPGPGPGRWVAVVLALLAVTIGLSRAFVRADDSTERRALIGARKKELLEAAKRLEAERKREEIGPEFHTRKMDEITTELALLLRDEESLSAKAPKVAPQTV